MSEHAESARLSLAQAAYVVARRDFRAILFSKAFLFFLLGPVFFGAVSLGAASVGQRTAENREPPVLAVSMDPADAAAIEVARNRLQDMIDLPRMERVDTGADPAKVLADRSRNYGGVLTGTLDAPRLTGTPESIERWRGEVALTAGVAFDQRAQQRLDAALGQREKPVSPLVPRIGGQGGAPRPVGCGGFQPDLRGDAIARGVDASGVGHLAPGDVRPARPPP
jgi:ABC-2 type transport system permease protein